MSSFSIDFESIQNFIILFQSRCMSDPTISDIDFKNIMAWVCTTLKVSSSGILRTVDNLERGLPPEPGWSQRMSHRSRGMKSIPRGQMWIVIFGVRILFYQLLVKNITIQIFKLVKNFCFIFDFFRNRENETEMAYRIFGNCIWRSKFCSDEFHFRWLKTVLSR